MLQCDQPFDRPTTEATMRNRYERERHPVDAFIEDLRRHVRTTVIQDFSPDCIHPTSIKNAMKKSADTHDGKRHKQLKGVIGEKIAHLFIEEHIQRNELPYSQMNASDFRRNVDFCTERGWTPDSILFLKRSTDTDEPFAEIDFAYQSDTTDDILVFDATTDYRKNMRIEKTKEKIQSLSETYNQNIHLIHLRLSDSYAYNSLAKNTHLFTIPCRVDIDELARQL